MKKKILSTLLVLAIMIFNFMPAIVNAEESNGNKEGWIDKTVDKSTTTVTGILKVKNLKTEEVEEIKVYDEVTSSTYSTATNPTVNQMIEEAKEEVTKKAKEYKEDFDSETLSVTPAAEEEKWDNRKYDTVVSSDAVVVGDTDYMPVDASTDGQTLTTHIASGDYGAKHKYLIEGYVEVSGKEELKITEGADQTYYKGSNKEIVIKTNGELDELRGVEIDNGNPIREEDMTLTSGSTVLTLKVSFLENSSLGEHTITFKYEEGEVETKLTIAEPEEDEPTSGEEEPTFKVIYDYNGGKDQDGKGKKETQQVAYAPSITKENFIDELGVTPPEGMELDAIEINGTRTELGDEYMLNKDTVYKYIWKSVNGEEEQEVVPLSPTTNTENAETASDNPKTGDNIVLYISFLGLSIIGLLGTVVYFKKNN